MQMTVVALLYCQLSLLVVLVILVWCPYFGPRPKERTTSMVSIWTVEQLVLQL